MNFAIFKPPEFKKAQLQIDRLNNYTNSNWQYASSGKACLYHILKPLSQKYNKILIPSYACDSILIPLRRLKLKPVFYDIDANDLNPALSSITQETENRKIKLLLAVSLYGNPANLTEIAQYCRKKKMIMIDDAAQSFGAKLQGRYVGTFGNAGFFSFSPGKATPGHMGGFFWTDYKYHFRPKTNCLFHYIKYLNFYYNRLHIYNYKYLAFVKKLLNILTERMDNKINHYEDALCTFEKKILGGILQAILSNTFSFRQKYHNHFVLLFKNNPYFTPIRAIRGEPNNHKLILKCQSKNIADKLMNYLQAKRVFFLNGYKPLTENLKNLPMLQHVNGRIIELPIEDNENKMNWLFNLLNTFEI